MKPLSIIIWSAISAYGIIFLLWHCWVKRAYHVARTGKILTKSQKMAMWFYPYIGVGAGISLSVFVMAVILRIIAYLLKSEL